MKKSILMTMIMAAAMIGCMDPGLPDNPMEITVFPIPANESIYVNVYHQGYPFELKAFNPKGKQVLDVKTTVVRASEFDFYGTRIPTDLYGTYYIILIMNGKEYRETAIRVEL